MATMDEPFIITTTFKGMDLDFTASLQILGYTHRFAVNIGGSEVFFERDEEGQYRAFIPPEKENSKIDPALLQSIAKSIQDILA